MQLAGTLPNCLWKRHQSPASEIGSHFGSLVLWETGQSFHSWNEPKSLQVNGAVTPGWTACEDGRTCIHYSLRMCSWNAERHECETVRGIAQNWSLKSQNKTKITTVHIFTVGTCGFTLTSQVREFQGNAKREELKALFAMYSSLLLPR